MEQEAVLKGIVAKGTDWRERERAATILGLARGESVKALAEKHGRAEETIRERRRAWWREGFASLVEGERCGAPSKLGDEHREPPKGWVEQEALTARVLVERLRSRYGKTISGSTLRTELKKLGFVWKRTRYSLKKKRDPERFEQARGELEALKFQAERGEIQLVYVDEAGFAPQP